MSSNMNVTLKKVKVPVALWLSVEWLLEPTVSCLGIRKRYPFTAGSTDRVFSAAGLDRTGDPQHSSPTL